MADVPDGERERPISRRSRRLVEALYSPDSYGLVLVLILLTYGLSVSLTTQAWAGSLVLAVQIATVTIRGRAMRRCSSAGMVVTSRGWDTICGPISP